MLSARLDDARDGRYLGFLGDRDCEDHASTSWITVFRWSIGMSTLLAHPGVKPAVQGEPQGPDLVLVLPRRDVVQGARLGKRERRESEECTQF